jgi:hypothetical protein
MAKETAVDKYSALSTAVVRLLLREIGGRRAFRASQALWRSHYRRQARWRSTRRS